MLSVPLREALAAEPLPYLLASLACLAALLYAHAVQAVAVVNPRKRFELTDSRVRREFIKDARGLLDGWFRDNPGRPVNINADIGVVTVLPPSMADEIRNDTRLSFTESTARTSQAHLPGFDGFRAGLEMEEVITRVITKDLTKRLAKITKPLADETSSALSDLFTDNTEWHTINLRYNVLRLVARLSSRVFLGEELCRNEEWLHITREYTVSSFDAADELRTYPSWARYLVQWMLPSCEATRTLCKRARRLIVPLVERRRRARAAAQARGETLDVDDALEWFDREVGDRSYDETGIQLGLSLAAIHTTTDLLCQTLGDLVQHPEVVGELRDEAKAVLGEEGWKKTSLFKLKLLDSVIKESQRLKPVAMVTMRRRALADVRLSDGTVIRRGGYVAVSSHNMWTDETVYESPGQWEAHRFHAMRDDEARRGLAQLVTTSAAHTAFGHGAHACPGRFFAANEVKIALVYMLLRYDVELPAGAAPPSVREHQFTLSHDYGLAVRVRRRRDDEVGLDLDALE